MYNTDKKKSICVLIFFFVLKAIWCIYLYCIYICIYIYIIVFIFLLPFDQSLIKMFCLYLWFEQALWNILHALCTLRIDYFTYMIMCTRYTVIHKNSWDSFSNDPLSITIEIQLNSLSSVSCCLPHFSKVTRNLGSSKPLSPAVVYRPEYKRALFRASRRMVLLKPYLELKGPMKFAYFLSPPLRQFLSGINLDLWSSDCDIKLIFFLFLSLPHLII